MEGIRTFLISSSSLETVSFGKRFGKKLRPGDVIALVGPLGSGKTTFAKGVALGLGVKDEDEVKSPTYVLVHQYQGKYLIYHLDLFRLGKIDEIEGIGWDDLLSNGAVILVEWADQVEGYLPKNYLQIEFKISGETKREISCQAFGEYYESLIQEVLREFKR